jgi:hypothetical protein
LFKSLILIIKGISGTKKEKMIKKKADIENRNGVSYGP